MRTLHDIIPSAQVGTPARATFQPVDVSTVRPEHLRFVGETFGWSAGWIIGSDDGHPAYVGMVAWQPELDLALEGMGWVPACDLIPIDADMLEYPI